MAEDKQEERPEDGIGKGATQAQRELILKARADKEEARVANRDRGQAELAKIQKREAQDLKIARKARDAELKRQEDDAVKSHIDTMARLKKSGRLLVYTCPDQTVIAYSYAGRGLYRQSGADEHSLGPRRKVKGVAEGHKTLPIKGIL